MRVCILSIMNIKHMSLISLYTSFFDKHGIDYDIIYVDRYNEVESIGAKETYRYTIKLERNWNKLRKVQAYWGFKRYAQEILKKNNYDYVIVWRTETALMFSKYLSKYMENKYIVNIRDYCMEKNPFIFAFLKKVIKSAVFTTISSDGFKKFLPPSNYITVHSFNENLLSKCEPKTSLKNIGDPIRVCFIGYVRFFENDKKLLEALGNDSRYIIQFFGEGSQYLKDFAKEKQIKNVEFISGFNVEETGTLLGRADVINNLYGYNNIALDTAISIRYYYSLYMKIPILVYKGTHMEEITSKTGTGYSVGESLEGLADDFYIWYHSIDFQSFKNSCEKEIENIKISNQVFNKKLQELLL